MIAWIAIGLCVLWVIASIVDLRLAYKERKKMDQYIRMIALLEGHPNKKQYLELLQSEFIIHKYEYTDDDNMKFSLSFVVEYATKVDGKWYYKTIDDTTEISIQ